ncbi:LytR/AlgR family response regulator transcription factor [Spirosoma montaniterrae]|uniref:Histidine kinase n=1 Tax=Spirosoma montaniterrae TaxID=1178516 RepID=A0A1P9X3F9_9BACT|nr:LytTR family transcriptional regulator DNA-binding domain-containing protein [Spirosoma montaniterrae]AQG82170.1 histidine kinase [Spirosoma montaniterrae]
MFKLLAQPYPTEESLRRRLLKSFTIGAFVGLFLLLFQPFGIDDWQTDAKVWKVLGFGAVTLAVLLLNWFALPALFPRFFSDAQWTVGREIVRVLSFILAIAIGNGLYMNWLFNRHPTIGSWLWIIGVTFLIGIFPTVGSIMLNYIIQLRRYSRSAATLNPVAHNTAESTLQTETASPPPLSDTLTLLADNEKDTLTLEPAKLLFIESSDNYCTVVYLKNDKPAKVLLRSSLSRMADQIQRPHIVRCHRSYIVNLDRVERVTGNAQGYKLHLLDGQFALPVSRQYNDTLVAELKAL